MSINPEAQYDKIYRYCYFKLHNRETAEDITQETFLRYFEKYPALTGERALKCLYTIARNLCIDEYRRQSGSRTDGFSRKDFPQNDFSQNDSMHRNCARKDDNSWKSVGRKTPALEELTAENFQEDRLLTTLTVREALSRLEQEEQELLLLRYVNEVPAAAIGRMFGLSRFAVHRRLAAVQKKFRKILEKMGGI